MTPPPDALARMLAEEHVPQRAFSYSKSSWHRWTAHLDGVDAVLKDLPNEISRRNVSAMVEELLPDNVAGAFTVAMIWGHGSSGYGPYRTASVLTASRRPVGHAFSAAVAERLLESVEIARDSGPVEGYRYLNNMPGKIAGLGPAFFTKWLYFVTARGNETSSAAALILDILVLRWMKANTDLTLRAGYTVDYARYIEVLAQWGEPYGKTPVQVEESIFRLIRNDGENRLLSVAP